MSIAYLIISALQFYSMILLVRVLMTWIPNLDYSNPIVRFLMEITEPVLQPIRNVLPQNTGIDFSPIVVFIGISILSRIVATLPI